MKHPVSDKVAAKETVEGLRFSHHFIMLARSLRASRNVLPRHPTVSSWTCCRAISTTRPLRIDDITVGAPVSPDRKPYYVTTPIFYVNAGK
jgi:hypothetical protein